MTDTTTTVTPATDEDVERYRSVYHRGSMEAAFIARIDALKAHGKRREQDATEGMAALNRVIADQRDELRERDATIARLSAALERIEKLPWANSESPYARIARAALEDSHED